MTVINRMRDPYRFLFGSGADGDLILSGDYNLPSSLNGGIIYRSYRDLIIPAGAVLSVSNMCRGLWLRVRGTLYLYGIISMSNKGCFVAGGGDEILIAYSDIKVPKVGAPAGTAGVDGQTGGGGKGGSSGPWNGGDGAAGAACGGGPGGGGMIRRDWPDTGEGAGWWGKNGYAASPYGQKGGDGESDTAGMQAGGGAGGIQGGKKGGNYDDTGWDKPPSDPTQRSGRATDGRIGSGGILIIMADRIEGSGSLLSAGSQGGDSYAGNALREKAGSGGGSGGGSITLFYRLMTGNINLAALGGPAGDLFYNRSQDNGFDLPVGGDALATRGQPGGDGSVRQYSLQQLLSHPRI